MAIQKNDAIAIGRGNINQNSESPVIFAANNTPETWLISITYAQYNVVEHSGKIYRSKIAGNTGNTPFSSPSQWETYVNQIKDSDVCIVASGANSSMYQRIAGIWGAVGSATLTMSLNDGQLTPAPAITFLGSLRAFSKIEYTVRRGFGHGRKRKGVFNILNDTISAINYDHEFVEIGIDTNVTLTPTMSGSDMVLEYTSAAESVAIEMKYILTGWT